MKTLGKQNTEMSHNDKDMFYDLLGISNTYLFKVGCRFLNTFLCLCK